MRGKELFKSFFKNLLAVFLPFRCHVCQNSTEFGLVICQACLGRLRRIVGSPRLVDDTRCDFPVYTLSSYDSFVADVVRIIKYRPSYKLLQILADVCLVSGDPSSILTTADIVVPVPMHSDRQVQRGFNQAEYLAERFAQHCGCHFSPALTRTRATRPQADCDEAERLKNLEQAFSTGAGLIVSAFRGRRIILIDDVATTGITLQKCAEALKPLQPANICALTVSHSFRRSGGLSEKLSECV